MTHHAAAAPAPARYGVAEGIATITLDSPSNRNALSSAMVDALLASVGLAAADPGVRAIVVTHTGRTFCAGADLTEARRDGMERTSRRLLELLRTIVACPKPVVARIDGHVRAGGLGLVAACDLAVAGPASTFAVTEVRLGLAPAVISVVLTPRLSSRDASRYYLTGETFDAREAARMRLVTLAADDVDAATAGVLAELRSGSPQGLAECKRLVSAAMLARIDAEGERLAALSAWLFASDEASEGMAAFAEKRSPSWISQRPSRPEPTPPPVGRDEA